MSIMWKSCLFFFLILFSFACNPDKSRSIDTENLVYKSNDASKLFFRNVRASYYDKQTLPEAKIDVYRMKNRNSTEDYPVLNLALVNNWLQDEAYIIIEPNSFYSVGDTIRVTWDDQKLGEQKADFVYGNKNNHTRFADKIYQNLLDMQSMKIHADGESWPLFSRNEDREIFRKTMIDFYRLVQRL